MLKTHEDTIEKHKITQEEIEFLKELQHEMLTQDHVGQAAPRFWVVAGTQRVYRGNEYSCDGEVLIHDSEEVADGLKDAIEYFKEHYYEEMENEKITIEPSELLSNHYKITKFNINMDNIEDGVAEGHPQPDEEEILFEQDCICNIDELLETLVDVGLISDNNLYDSASYSNEHYRYPDTMFLTNRSCKEHIKANHYHYSGDAHSYAMTAWRSPEVEKLFKILEEVDWDNVLQLMQNT